MMKVLMLIAVIVVAVEFNGAIVVVEIGVARATNGALVCGDEFSVSE